MNVDGIKSAIVARVQNDTGSGGLWASGARLIDNITYWFEGRGSTTGIRGGLRTVAFEIPVQQNSDGYLHDNIDLWIRMHILYPFLRNKDAAIAVASNIVDRLYGDAMGQATRIPSYGFHRHTLSLGAGLQVAPWQGGIMHFTNLAENHGDSELHFVLTFKVNQFRQRAT